ncbi:MAG: hypothetical protein IT429_14510 [Gemmataceae bacterium]|nr:hypothetical protein [Gemmataceae bacterium]
MADLSTRIAPNWTSAAGAIEGVLVHLGVPLPRHAIMGLTGHAFRLCLGTKGGVVALPSGVADYDYAAMADRYARTGVTWERFAAEAPPGGGHRSAEAAAWVEAHLAAGRPVAGWDFHLHEFAVVHGFDPGRGGFLVDDVLTPEVGAFSPLAGWPALGRIELLAPMGESDLDPLETVILALQTALECFEGADGPPDQPRGTAALDAWATALDGAAFLEDLTAALPDLAGPLGRARDALREETTALSPLLTLFPFPSGGHGNVANAGLRRAAATALRRAARHERAAAAAIQEALALAG